MSLSRLLSQAQSQLAERLQALPSPYILFFSLSDGKTRARVIRATGETFLKAWQEGARRCQNAARSRQRLDVRWLRIDWPTDIQQTTWAGFKQRLAATKRNYFRFGIALDAEFRQFFLEGELNANAMLYSGGKKTQAELNEKNFMVCARRHFGKKLVLDFADSELDATPVWLFAHDGLFVSNDAAIETLPGDAPLWVAGAGLVDRAWNDAAVLDSGRRDLGALEPDSVLPLIKSSADFLARQVKKDGQFVYGHFPNFGRLIPTYNTLRHASSIYSMLEAWELMQDNAPLLAAIRRALDYLDTQIIRRYPQSDGDTLAFNVDVNDEIKLGANAVSLLALVKYDELTGDTRYRPLMAQLAAGICFLQRGEVDEQGQPTGQHPGKFLHVLNAEDLSLKEAFRIVYYDGEAAFGLMRLYGLTKDARWLETVERAFDYFLEMDHWRHHDHWLSYCANELTLYKPEEKYFRFGVQNIANHLNFILTRETTYPTLLELSMAFAAMLRRIQTDHPEMMHVLDGLDIDKFHRAMHHRAHYLLNGFFWPELAMYVAKPHTVVGSFFIRHHAFRVRIDDIEHYLSGYVAYWKLLKRGDKGRSQIAPKSKAADTAQALRPAPAADKPSLQSAPIARGPVVAWGGDVNLGRRQHYRTAELGVENVLRIPALSDADLSIVNLECVVATSGEQGAPKGEGGPYYYRARPEMLRVLTTAGVDVVATANNHSGDYGPEALLEQGQWLDAVGIGYAGSGANMEAAFAPVFRRAGDLSVALFSIDASMAYFSSAAESPGSAYLPLTDLQAWHDMLAPRIAAARTRAHVVLVAVHWGVAMKPAPGAAEIAVGHTLIESGADAVLGASAHQLQGIEIYQGRPILHNAGDLLFDAVRHKLGDSGVFHLELSKYGVTRVSFIPVGLGFGFSEQFSGEQAIATSQRFIEKCAALGTELSVTNVGSAFIELMPPARTKPACELAAQTQYQLAVLDKKISQIDSRWQMAELPADARISPISLGPLTLLGVRVKPLEITRRQMLWVESFWRCDEVIDEDIRLDIRGVPITPTKMRSWGVGMDHDPCDWMVPTSRWQPGTIYRDYYGLRPPYFKDWKNVDLRLTINIISRKYATVPVSLPFVVKLKVPGKDQTQLQPRTSKVQASTPFVPGKPDRQAIVVNTDVGTTCYFCIYSLGGQLAGIERASLARASMFAEHLGIVPHFLSNHLDPWIMERWEHYRTLGWVDMRVGMTNLYDDVLEITSGSDQAPAKLSYEADVRVEEVPGSPLHQRIRSANGRLRYYVVWRDRKGGRLNYINHFSNGLKLRRDHFNRFGQLQISQALGEKEQVLWETCFMPNGKRRLVRRFDPARGAITQIEHFNGDGLLDAVFDSESALTTWWLQQRITTAGNLFVVDRGPQWSRGLYAFRQSLPQRQFLVTHSAHVMPDQDPMKGALRIGDLSKRDSAEARVVLTEWQRDEIVARFPGGCPLVVIPHSIDAAIVETDFDARDPDLLVAAVRLAEDKRIEDMIAIMGYVVRSLPGKKLHIYGEGSCRKAIETLIQNQGLQDSVRLMGYVENVGEILDRAIFSLLTSRREGFPRVVLESLAHGCPAFAYDIRYGPGSMIEHGRNGLLVANGDVEQGAAELVAALSNREQLRSMSMQAYAKARNFDQTSIAKKWRGLFDTKM